jgi:hypothetical protein
VRLSAAVKPVKKNASGFQLCSLLFYFTTKKINHATLPLLKTAVIVYDYYSLYLLLMQ